MGKGGWRTNCDCVGFGALQFAGRSPLAIVYAGSGRWLAVNLERLQVYFETSPALRLLRSPNAAFIVDFLDQQFKRAGRIAVPFSDLHAALAALPADRSRDRSRHPARQARELSR